MSIESFDVVIIGGGPAGISAALWCDELGLESVLIESGNELGGQLNWTFNAIKNYLGVDAENGAKMRDLFCADLLSRKTPVTCNATVDRIDFELKRVSTSSGKLISYNFLVIATGVRRRNLEVVGEKKFKNKGVLFSGKRDRDLVKGKSVAIVGGGDAAFENAQILAKVAAKVWIIHRREDFRARREFILEAEADPKITIVVNSVVTGLTGEKMLETIRLSDTITGETRDLDSDFILVRIGVLPNVEILAGEVDLKPDGYIQTKEDCETSIDSVYAIGDVVNSISPTIQTATGNASHAIKAIYRKLA